LFQVKPSLALRVVSSQAWILILTQCISNSTKPTCYTLNATEITSLKQIFSK
jgi:hypothetical protein